MTSSYGHGLPWPRIYRLCGRGALDPRHFREIFVSRHRRVRIAEVLQVSEESRSWRQRNCDAPGSWYLWHVMARLLKSVDGGMHIYGIYG